MLVSSISRNCSLRLLLSFICAQKRHKATTTKMIKTSPPTLVMVGMWMFRNEVELSSSTFTSALVAWIGTCVDLHILYKNTWINDYE